MIIASQLLQKLFIESHGLVKVAAAGLTHEESIQTPACGGNSIHWIVGHLVVARCNFMMLLAVPSLWDWPTCKLFIPGSSPSAESAGHIDFSQLLADFDRTQDQLLAALSQTETSALEAVKEDKTVAAHLADYAQHEAFHAGQLDLLQQKPLRS